jgi:hypothetical protein
MMQEELKSFEGTLAGIRIIAVVMSVTAIEIHRCPAALATSISWVETDARSFLCFSGNRTPRPVCIFVGAGFFSLREMSCPVLLPIGDHKVMPIVPISHHVADRHEISFSPHNVCFLPMADEQAVACQRR